MRQWTLPLCVAKSTKLKGSGIMTARVLAALSVAFSPEGVQGKRAINGAAISKTKGMTRRGIVRIQPPVGRSQKAGTSDDAMDSTDLNWGFRVEANE